MNTTENNVTFNFVGTVYGRLCPGNSNEAILASSKAHMNPFELIFVACLVVAVFAMIPVLIKFETWLFDLDGDGQVDGADVVYCLRVYCCCGRKNRQALKTGVKVLRR